MKTPAGIERISIINHELSDGQRERYMGRRVLRCSPYEFDSGQAGSMFKPGSGRGKNRVVANINMKCTCQGCPVQYEGTINRKKAYYRSRHGSWYLEIYEDKLFEKVLYREEGEHSDPIGYYGMLMAEDIIVACAMHYAHKIKNKTGMAIPHAELEK